MNRVYDNILQSIGNTPLIRLNRVVKGTKAKVYAKVESFNPGNSIKDRMALKMVEDAEADGRLKPGGTIVEGTSGNTGMGLALAGIVKGYKCIFVTTDKQSKEKVDILKAMGAEVFVCPTDVPADDPRSYYSVADRIARELPNAWYVNQYDNPSNSVAHYETTGPELWEQTEGKITHLIVGVGTGGTISGTGRYLKEKNPNIKIWGVDSYGSVLKKFHETGEFDEKEIYPYITEGIGEDIIPENIDFKVIDHFEKVTDKDGAVYARKLAKEEGIFAGYSCGSAVAAANQLADQLGEDDVVVLILHDHGSRYVAKIYNDEWMRERKWLDEAPTAKTILETKDLKGFISVEPGTKVADAFQTMKDHNISQLPVAEGLEVVGSLTENGILESMMQNGANMEKAVSEIMNQPFPFVNLDDTVQAISRRINRQNSAVLVKDTIGNTHIITEYDLIEAMAH
jgi:cystathionine beta-synthase